MIATGTVTLSLAEVDALRDAIKEGDQKVQELNKELTEVRADKRVLKVTTHRLDTSYKSYYIDTMNIVNLVREYLSRSGNSRHGIYAHYERDLENGISRYIRPGSNVYEAAEDKIEFVNFDDVREQLRQQMDQELSTEVGTLRESVKKHIQRQSELTEEYNQKAIDLGKTYNQQVLDLRKTHSDEVLRLEQDNKDLQKQYDDLKFDRDTRTTEEKLNKQIEDLKKELAEQKAKKWYQR